MLVKGSLVLQAHWLFPVHFSPSDTGLLNRVIDFIGTDNIQQVSNSSHIPQVFSYRIKAKLNLKMKTQSVPLLKRQWIKEKVPQHQNPAFLLSDTPNQCKTQSSTHNFTNSALKYQKTQPECIPMMKTPSKTTIPLLTFKNRIRIWPRHLLQSL